MIGQTTVWTNIFVFVLVFVHDVFVTFPTPLCSAGTGVQVFLELVEGHFKLTDLAFHCSFAAFLGLMMLQLVLLHALVTKITSDLLVCFCLMVFHILLSNWFITFWTESEKPQAVGLMEGEIGSRHISLTVFAERALFCHDFSFYSAGEPFS